MILSVAVPRPLDGLFTYRIPDALLDRIHVGGWTLVPFGRKTLHAYVVEPPKQDHELAQGVSPESLKEILEVGQDGPVIPQDVLSLCKWAHEYYLSPLGEVLNCAVPAALLGLKSARREARKMVIEARSVRTFRLTEEQAAAFAALEALRTAPRASGEPRVALLDGVTGSGKTEIYIELAKKALAEGRGVILLVPEIALTSQLHRRLEEGLGVGVGLWHSAMPDGKRRDLFSAVRLGEIRVVVGARSAVFAPVRELGLLIVDEEHDPTYKQEDRVRYHARDLAVVRGKLCDALVVLGSATPSLETRERVSEGRYSVARLPTRVSGGALPSVDIVDLREEERVADIQAPFARRTIEAIQATIEAGEQVIVFLNRRGFAAFLVCQDCGEVRECPNCSISLTVHRRAARLRCHVCGHHEAIPTLCPKCQGDQLEAMGAGTESLEQELPGLVPGLIPIRLDRDQITSNARLEKVLEDFRSQRANALLGTQMLVKGHDFPGVTLVVVVLADALFRWPDFRATERALQVLKQVSGRAGRGGKAGRVLIQTFKADHPVLQAVQGVLPERDLLEAERELRSSLGYPPFGRMARIRFEGKTREEAQSQSMQVAKALVQWAESGRKTEILGPSEAFLERAKGIFRWDILLKSRDIRDLQGAVILAKKKAAAHKWQVLVDIDPYGVGS